MLINGSFEIPWDEGGTNRVRIFHADGRVEDAERDNVSSPPGWTVWYRHGLPVDHDPDNDVGWAQPETRLLPPQSSGPRRVLDGDWAFLLFTFYRIHDGGLFQVVDVEPGRRYRLVAHAHAWSNHDQGPHPDDPAWSEGAGYGHFDRPESYPDLPPEARNFTFWVGLDPAGGLDPYAETVVWSPARHVYNDYGRFEVEAEAAGPRMTVFLRSRALWPYKHNDAYWDAVSLVPAGQSVSVLVLPDAPEAGASVEVVLSAPAPLTHVELVLSGPSGEAVPVQMQYIRQVGATWRWGFVSEPLPAPGEYVATASADGGWEGSLGFTAAPAQEPGPPPPPPSSWPYPVVGRGSKLGVHTIWPARTVEYLAQGFRPPVFKAVDQLEVLHAVKEVFPGALTVARRVSPFESCPGVADPDADLPALRDALFAPVLESLDADPDLAGVVDWWEICNEPDPPGPDGYARLAELTALCIDRAEELGLRLALFSLNAGTPEWAEMEALAESGVFGPARAGGHVLAVHEGVFSPDQPIDLWFLDDIPGCPPGLGKRIRAGALCFRYRFLAHLLQERGELVPVVVTEWYPGSPDPSEENLARVAWYDGEMAADYYALGFCPFTLGPTPPWDDLAPLYEDRLLAYAAAAQDRPNALPPSAPEPPEPGPCHGAPRVQYERTYILLPPDADDGLAAMVFDAAWSDFRATVGGSADDAGIGDLDSRFVIAVNPDGWPGDLRAFFEEHYPGIEVQEVDLADSPNPYQVRGRIAAAKLLRLLGRPLHLPTTHLPLTPTDLFGVSRGTYYHNGIDLRGSLSVWGDRALAAWEGEVVVAGVNPDEPWFGVQVRTRAALSDGTELLLRYAHLAEGSLAVAVGDRVSPGDPLGGIGSTGSSTGDHLHFDVKWRGIPVDPGPLLEGAEGPPPEPVRVGINDPDVQGGGLWMLEHGTGLGLYYVPLAIGDRPRAIDFSALAEKGVRVVVNLRWSWSTDAGGSGTLPPPGRKDAFVAAALETIRRAKGVHDWTIGNEPNNPREHPPGFFLTPHYAAEVYNAIYDRAEARMAPPPVDPYFGPFYGDPEKDPWADCGRWFEELWRLVHGADFVDVHGYIRGPDPALVGSLYRFADPPLTWQFLNFHRCFETLLHRLPDWARTLRVLVSECNHMKTDDGSFGWVADGRAPAILDAALDALRRRNVGASNQVFGLALYRWAGDAWAIEGNGPLLARLSEVLKGG